jgi:hypothetical protein
VKRAVVYGLLVDLPAVRSTAGAAAVSNDTV